MENSKYNDLNEGIKNIIKNALLECAELKYLDKEIFNEANECFGGQWWYLEEYNKVYLYYELDDRMRYTFDPEMVFSTINKNILQTFPPALNCHCEILGAPSNWFLLERDYLSPNVFHSDDITAFTISWWKDWNGNCRFINDKHVIQMQLTSFNTEEERRATFANQEYLNLLQEIRERYKIIRDTDPENFNMSYYWRDYAELYEDRFGKRLRSVDESSASIPYGGSHPIIFDVFYEEGDINDY